MNGKYILENGIPVLCSDLMVWAKWFEDNRTNRHVADDRLPNGIRVSTVFLGLDHQFGDGPPLLWETMIFGGPHDDYQQRYSTLADAKAGHAYALELAQTDPVTADCENEGE